MLHVFTGVHARLPKIAWEHQSTQLIGAHLGMHGERGTLLVVSFEVSFWNYETKVALSIRVVHPLVHYSEWNASAKWWSRWGFSYPSIHEISLFWDFLTHYTFYIAKMHVVHVLGCQLPLNMRCIAMPDALQGIYGFLITLSTCIKSHLNFVVIPIC